MPILPPSRPVEGCNSSGLIGHIQYLEKDCRVSSDALTDLFTPDLGFERKDDELLRKAIGHCATVGDFTTRHLLEHMIEDSEEHVDWFETQLRAAKQVGLRSI